MNEKSYFKMVKKVPFFFRSLIITLLTPAHQNCSTWEPPLRATLSALSSILSNFYINESRGETSIILFPGSHIVWLSAQLCGQQWVHHHQDQLPHLEIPDRQLGHWEQWIHFRKGFNKMIFLKSRKPWK